MEYTKTVQTKHWNHLSESLLDRLKNGKHTDCTFVIGKTKTEFKLNRFILSLISPVFEGILFESVLHNILIFYDTKCGQIFICTIYIISSSTSNTNTPNYYKIKSIPILNELEKTNLHKIRTKLYQYNQTLNIPKYNKKNKNFM